MTKPFAIAVAPNGARRTKADHPRLPITASEIARDAAEALEAGAAMIHLHVRDTNGAHTLDADLYREAVAAVKETVGDRLVIQITTEAVGRYTPQEQIAVIDALTPESVSIALREILPEVAAGRVIAAHLGSGASACAMVNGVSRETTMGFTALDGLPMGTRPGRLDAGVVLWMLEQGMGHDEIQDLLYNRSGLKGLSGISNDMRTLLASTEPAARLAVDYFTYRAAESIAGLCVASQGLDAIVFTAGVGENSPEVRAEICRRLEWMGIRLDEAANSGNALTISRPDSSIGVYVVPTNEEAVIARHTRDVILGRR